MSRGVKFWVLVSPLVVFFSANLAPFQLGRLFLPCVEHFEHGGIGGTVGLVQPQTHFPVNLSDFQSIHIFQCEKGVHKTDVAVNVGNINCSSIDDLMKKTYNLKDISVDNQPMGSKFLDIESLKPGTNYYGKEEIFTNKPAEYSFYSTSNIEVYRTASRIDFEKISLKWSEADGGDLLQEGARFRLKQVYVVDAKSTTYLADHKSGENNYSVEITSDPAYLHGNPEKDGYLASLNLFPREGDNTSATISSDGEWDITDNPLRCYITENTDEAQPTMLVLKGDILHKDTDTPILSDRYYFVKLLNLIDSDNKETIYPGVIRNKVIRISATITGKGSGDEEYKENAYVTVTVTPENWSVETQHEDVN